MPRCDLARRLGDPRPRGRTMPPEPAEAVMGVTNSATGTNAHEIANAMAHGSPPVELPSGRGVRALANAPGPRA